VSQPLDSTQTAVVTSSAYGLQILADLEFQSAGVPSPLYFTTNVMDIAANGHTYIGRGNLFDVQGLGESENSADEKLGLSMSLVNTALLAAAMGDATNYRNRVARLYYQFVDGTHIAKGLPIYFWRGYMDSVNIERQPASDGPSTGRVVLTCRRAGLARSRRADGLRLSDAQHQATYAGDKGYEYIQTLLERPTPIITKRYLETG
jgi:hypothetical protein